MDIRHLYVLTISNFKVYTRVRQSLIFSLIFPLVFVGVFGLAFQEGDPGNTTIKIALINNDIGLPNGVQLVETALFDIDHYSSEFLDILSKITFEDGDTNIFQIEDVTNEDIETVNINLEKRRYKALLILDEDFSKGVLTSRRVAFENVMPIFDWTGYPETSFTTDIKLQGDATLVSFSITSQVLDAVITSYFAPADVPLGGQLIVSGSTQTEGLTTFDLVVPGLLIFAIINNLGTTAAVAVRDIKDGQLRRLRLTRITNSEYILGIVISQLMISSIQIPILLGTAMLFGFPMTLNIFISAFILSMLVSLAITGMGILVAGFVSSPDAAGGLAAIIGTPMAFLAGAFFSMPNPVLIASGGILGDNSLKIFDFLPPTNAISALRLLLVGRSVNDIWFELVFTLILAMIYLGLGIFVFSRKQLRAE